MPPQSQMAFIPVREAGAASGNAEFFFFIDFHRMRIYYCTIFYFSLQRITIHAMKKRLLALFLLSTAAVLAFAQEPLETAIRQKDWPALAAQFDDDTHLQLAAYFQECQEVGFSLLRPNNLMFFARFQDVAEIGELAFERENGRYRRLALKRTIKPLYFIRSFSRYAVADRRLRMGDAEIHFHKGFIYRGMPMGNVFLFSGEWEFRIRPDSEEERLTLQSLERSDTLAKEARAGVFVLNSPGGTAGRPARAGARRRRPTMKRSGRCTRTCRSAGACPSRSSTSCGISPSPPTSTRPFSTASRASRISATFSTAATRPTPAWCCCRRTSST